VTGFQVFACNPVHTANCVNGRTTTRGLPDAADYQIIGNANPDFTVGLHNQLNWGKFNISFLLRASLGQDVFNNTALVYSTKSNALQDKNFLAPALSDGPTSTSRPSSRPASSRARRSYGSRISP